MEYGVWGIQMFRTTSNQKTGSKTPGSIKICNAHKNPIKLNAKTNATYQEQGVYADFTELLTTIIKLDHVFHTKPSITLLVLSPFTLPATCLTYNVLRGSIRRGAHGKQGKQEPSIMTATPPVHSQTQDILLTEVNSYGTLQKTNTVKLNGKTNI